MGVILAALVAVMGYLLASSGGSSTSSEVNTVHGSCNAAGNNNTVNCSNGTSGTGQ